LPRIIAYVISSPYLKALHYGSPKTGDYSG
jgi:hypothetical protein